MAIRSATAAAAAAAAAALVALWQQAGLRFNPSHVARELSSAL
jgi:hypothetical protein